MLLRNNSLQLLNDLNNIFDIGLRPKDDSNVESSRWVPAVDIIEDTDKFLLAIDLPGVNSSEVEVAMENNILTLKGSRKESYAEDKQSCHRIERVKGSFYRRFTLPDTADAENVTAKSKDGVLEICIGKKKAATLRKIAIEQQSG